MRKELDFFKRNGYFQYPKTMQIEITTMCPLRCPQCFIHEFPHKHMDMQLFKNIIEEASLLGVKSVVLFGGEPLCHPNVEDMINYVICKNINVFIYTSGWNIQTLIKIYKSNPRLLKILISLNGSKKEIHELSRNGFALTYIAAQQLGVHDVQYGINWVSRHDNVRDLENLIRIAKDLKAQYINIVGNKMASDYSIQEPLTIEDYEYIRSVYIKYNDFLVIENCNAHLLNYSGKSTALSGCTAGITNCSITIDGDYVPCLRLLHKEKYDSIASYWLQSKILDKLRSNLKAGSNCQDCRYSKKCRFCRAISKTSYLTFENELPGCILKEAQKC